MAESKITKELLQKAMACETPEEFIELAKAEGFTVTKEEAEAFLAQTQDVELDSVDLQAAAGGCTKDCGGVRCWCSNINGGGWQQQ